MRATMQKLIASDIRRLVLKVTMPVLERRSIIMLKSFLLDFMLVVRLFADSWNHTDDQNLPLISP